MNPKGSHTLINKTIFRTILGVLKLLAVAYQSHWNCHLWQTPSSWNPAQDKAQQLCLRGVSTVRNTDLKWNYTSFCYTITPTIQFQLVDLFPHSLPALSLSYLMSENHIIRRIRQTLNLLLLPILFGFIFGFLSRLLHESTCPRVEVHSVLPPSLFTVEQEEVGVSGLCLDA